MDAQISPTESKKYVKAFLQALNSLYGTPIVVVRDMSKQIREAVTDVFPEAPQQILHRSRERIRPHVRKELIRSDTKIKEQIF